MVNEVHTYINKNVKTSCGARHNKPRPLLPPSEWYWLVNASELRPVITNKLTFDPPTRLPELNQNLIRSSHGHSTPSLKISCKSVQPFFRNDADKETKKERDHPKTIPHPPTGGRVKIFQKHNAVKCLDEVVQG